MQLGAVLLQVIQLPGTVSSQPNQFPIIHPNGGIAFVSPVKGITFDRLIRQRRAQTAPFHWWDRVPLKFFWIFGAAEMDTRRHDIDQVAGLLPELAFAGNSRRPMDD